MRKYEEMWSELKAKRHLQLSLMRSQHKRLIHGLRLEALADYAYRFKMIEANSHHEISHAQIGDILYITLVSHPGVPKKYVPDPARIKRRAEVKCKKDHEYKRHLTDVDLKLLGKTK